VADDPDEPTLADVQRQYPSWRCWRAVSGLYCARPDGTKPGEPGLVQGEDPLDLSHQILRAESLGDQSSSAGSQLRRE
jgi:hypothetical protein